MRAITDLDELKAIELDIMKKVHEFCEEKKIWYVLTYGTLIGAIRHNGFIPWDDDIDIFVMRDGFERIEKEFPEWGKDHGLFLAGPDSKDHYFPRDMLKICDARTSLFEKAYKRTDKLGVFVDVWVLDEVPQNIKLSANWIKRANILRAMNLYANTSWKYAKENMSTRSKLIVRFFNWHRTEPIIAKQQALVKKYRNTEGEKFICVQGDCILYDRSDFAGRSLHKFEDCEFYIPDGYDKVLKYTYGDYMTLPPEELREPHHIQDVWWN